MHNCMPVGNELTEDPYFHALASCSGARGIILGPPVVPLDLFWGEASPTKIDYRKEGTPILTSLLEDLAYFAFKERAKELPVVLYGHDSEYVFCPLFFVFNRSDFMLGNTCFFPDGRLQMSLDLVDLLILILCSVEQGRPLGLFGFPLFVNF